MEAIIKVTEQNGKQAVSARELHSFLEATERFSSWMERQFQYGFIENTDYVGCKVFNTLANQELEDFVLTLDCAKEISMLQKSEKGKQARQYFIACEKKLKEQFAVPTSFKEALLLAAHQQEQIELQAKQLELQAPKVLFSEAIIGSKSSCLIGELAKILSQNGISIGQNRMFAWLRQHHFLGTKGERYNIPNQQHIEAGLFELKKGTRSGDNGVMHTTITPKITSKGQYYFINGFISGKFIA